MLVGDDQWMPCSCLLISVCAARRGVEGGLTDKAVGDAEGWRNCSPLLLVIQTMGLRGISSIEVVKEAKSSQRIKKGTGSFERSFSFSIFAARKKNTSINYYKLFYKKKNYIKNVL
jgi:hypothetical protein